MAEYYTISYFISCIKIVVYIIYDVIIVNPVFAVLDRIGCYFQPSMADPYQHKMRYCVSDVGSRTLVSTSTSSNGTFLSTFPSPFAGSSITCLSGTYLRFI